MLDGQGLRYEAIIFDCDGVLLDSNGFKIDAFRKTLESSGFLPEVTSAGSAWQSVSFGIPRNQLFAEMLRGRFGPPPDVTIEHLLDDFGARCKDGYLTALETPRLRSVLSILAAHSKLYIVSGSDQSELREVLVTRDLDKLFDNVFGSPRTKVENIRLVRRAFVKDVGHEPARILFVGDAFADLEAANASGCDFVFMARYSTVRDSMIDRSKIEGFRVIEELGGLIGVDSPKSDLVASPSKDYNHNVHNR